jgi:hypothetical protein
LQDAGPVSILGLSLGGALTMILTCLEGRSRSPIPQSPRAVRAGRRRPVSQACGRKQQFGWGADELREFVANRVELCARVASAADHLFAASDDRFFVPAIVDEQWHRWGRPAIRWYPCSHVGIISCLPDVMKAVREFIDHHDVGAVEATHPMRTLSTALLTA